MKQRGVWNYIFLITILKHIKLYRCMTTHRATASLYTVPLSAVNGLSRLTKLTTSKHGRFDSKIFESANPFRIE